MGEWLLPANKVTNALFFLVIVLLLIALVVEVVIVVDSSEKIGDFVRVHARCWDFYRTGPIEVIVAESEGQ